MVAAGTKSRATGAGGAVLLSEGLSRYQALVNISVPQRLNGVKTDQNDLVEPGGYCMLTEEEARNLMATGGKTGRRHPAVRPAAEGSEPLPLLLPRQFSGGQRKPPEAPPPGYVGPRADPAGSSQVFDLAPQTDGDLDGGGAAVQEVQTGDAVDIPPSGAGAAAAARVAGGQGG